MKKEKLVCANDGCENLFTKKTHNQLYCSDECCRIATNKKIMQKYYEKRDQRLGKPRFCKECKTTKLSRYNDNKLCSACQMRNEENIKNQVIEMLSNTMFA